MEAGQDHRAHGTTEHSGVRGVALDVKRRWCQYDGASSTYERLRVSVVYFNAPFNICELADLARLRSLGFPTPAMPRAWAYQVFVCC